MTRSLSEKLALSIFARDGIAAIWQLNLHAAGHTGRGTRAPRYPFLEIADAAEQTWLRAEGARIFT